LSQSLNKVHCRYPWSRLFGRIEGAVVNTCLQYMTLHIAESTVVGGAAFGKVALLATVITPVLFTV